MSDEKNREQAPAAHDADALSDESMESVSGGLTILNGGTTTFPPPIRPTTGPTFPTEPAGPTILRPGGEL